MGKRLCDDVRQSVGDVRSVKETHDFEGSQAPVIRYDSEEIQRALMEVLNDTRRDDMNEDPRGGIEKSLLRSCWTVS